MNKEEIKAKIDSLKFRVKKPGRAYSKAQRDEMRKEISNLNIELNKIRFDEDLIFISDFEKMHPFNLIPEKEIFKNKIDKITNETTDSVLNFVLELKIKSFNSDIDNLSFHQKNTLELIDALTFLEKNERVPSFNPNCYKKKDEIQKSLAGSFRAINSINNKLTKALNGIQTIINFFATDNKSWARKMFLISLVVIILLFITLALNTKTGGF